MKAQTKYGKSSGGGEPKVKDTGRQMKDGSVPEQTDRSAQPGSASRPEPAWYGEGGDIPKSKAANPAGVPRQTND